MSFKKSLVCLGFATLAFSSVSMAADFGVSTGTVDFNGTIVNTPCSITAANQNLKVDLGNVPAADFAKKGDIGGSPKQFTIVLSNCTVLAAPYKATVSFGGLGADVGKTSLATSAGQDTSGQPVATGVGIRIVEGNSTTPVVLDKFGTAVDITQPEMHLEYAAQYVSIADAVTPGLANGHADFTVAYE
ncbi:fimbrial protein [Rahnella sp. PCH160]|uniref:fimbrial protein n=1 Tax=Rahnella sp. PCH160 TaxID=3447928 RepID=UPI0039FC796B